MAPEAKIEITPEMIDAGVETYAIFAEGPLDLCLASVFEVMAKAAGLAVRFYDAPK